MFFPLISYTNLDYIVKSLSEEESEGSEDVTLHCRTAAKATALMTSAASTNSKYKAGLKALTSTSSESVLKVNTFGCLDSAFFELSLNTNPNRHPTVNNFRTHGDMFLVNERTEIRFFVKK